MIISKVLLDLGKHHFVPDPFCAVTDSSQLCRKHPHRDAEIFTYIVEGQLSHEDSMGNKEALPRGCVQYLSAGTGITHSVGCMTCCLFGNIFILPVKEAVPNPTQSSHVSMQHRMCAVNNTSWGTASAPS